MNVIFKTLRENNFVLPLENKVNRYNLTSDAIKVVETINKLSKK